MASISTISISKNQMWHKILSEARQMPIVKNRCMCVCEWVKSVQWQEGWIVREKEPQIRLSLHNRQPNDSIPRGQAVMGTILRSEGWESCISRWLVLRDDFSVEFLFRFLFYEKSYEWWMLLLLLRVILFILLKCDVPNLCNVWIWWRKRVKIDDSFSYTPGFQFCVRIIWN